MTSTERKPRTTLGFEKDHEYLPGGYVRCIPHDYTAKGRDLIRHSLSEHLADTLVRLVLQVLIFMSLGAAGTLLLQRIF